MKLAANLAIYCAMIAGMLWPEIELLANLSTFLLWALGILGALVLIVPKPKSEYAHQLNAQSSIHNGLITVCAITTTILLAGFGRWVLATIWFLCLAMRLSLLVKQEERGE